MQIFRQSRKVEAHCNFPPYKMNESEQQEKEKITEKTHQNHNKLYENNECDQDGYLAPHVLNFPQQNAKVYANERNRSGSPRVYENNTNGLAEEDDIYEKM